MLIKIIQAFRRAALLLGIGCMVPLGAQAGLVSGTWDPAFGPYLPGLSWSASFKMQIPNTCSNQADGDYATIGDCALTTGYVEQLRLYLFNTGDTPLGYFELGSYGWNVGSVRVKNGQIVGVNTGASPVFELTYSFDGTDYFSNPSSAKGNTFDLSFNLNGAKLTCLHCVNTFSNQPPPGTNYDLPNIDSSPVDVKQFLITYTDNVGFVPKFTDSSGQALGARLDGNGGYLGQSTSISAPLVGTVPEPGGLPLVLTAVLTGAAALRRRRSPPPPGVPSAA